MAPRSTYGEATARAASHWERREHRDRCRRGEHLIYRVRKPSWVVLHCKLCYFEDVELYEDSPLNMREEVAA